MTQFAPIIAAVAGVAGAYTQYKSQSEAAAAQKDAARESQRLAEINARNEERETARQAENLRLSQQKEEATNRARAAASGIAVSPGGSYDLTLKEQEDINKQQLGWLKQSGANQADILRRQGKTSYDVAMADAKTTKYGSYGSLLGGVQGLYDTGSKASWW
jgi:hypothetical protein